MIRLLLVLPLLLCACPGSPIPGECDEDALYEQGYALGEDCIDWITVWDDDDGLCAATALADGYNDARAESGEDCGESPIVIGPRDFIVAPSQ